MKNGDTVPSRYKAANPRRKHVGSKKRHPKAPAGFPQGKHDAHNKRCACGGCGAK
jgi:hypothetical protein